MDPWLAGLVAGAIASAAMLPLMTLAMSGPSSPALLAGRVLNMEPERLAGIGMLGHFAYGILWGIAFAIVTIEVFEQEDALWAWGLGLGAILIAIMIFVSAPLTGRRARMAEMSSVARMRTMFLALVAHAIYGVVLGALVQVWGT